MTDRGKPEERSLMCLVAELYYERRLNQQQIGELIGSSAPTVSRLLARALDNGIVEIRVVKDAPDLDQLSTTLTDRFGVEVRVVAGQHSDPQSESRLAGVAAAPVVTDLLPRQGLVGWASGQTMTAFAESLGSLKVPPFDSVALIGGWDGRPSYLDANDLVRSMAQLNGGRAYVINAPAWFPTTESRDSMLTHPQVVEVVRLWDQVEVALTGSGMPPDVPANYMTTWDNRSFPTRDEFVKAGVVGDVLGRFFDISGNLVNFDIEHYMISPTLEQVRAIPKVIALLGGHSKARSLIGMGRTGLADVIITDSHCAQTALDLLDSD